MQIVLFSFLIIFQSFLKNTTYYIGFLYLIYREHYKSYFIKIIYKMGIEGSKPLERKPTKTKSNLNEKLLSNQEIVQFASQLNSIVCSDSRSNQLSFLFQKMPFIGKFNPLPYCATISNDENPVFICYDCSVDDHAFLCEPCFEKGNHQGHRFRILTPDQKRPDLFCRCGDYDFMKKNTICEKHKEVKKLPSITLDQKQKKLFSAYFNEIFKTIISLANKSNTPQLLIEIFNYLQRLTTNNLYYSTMLGQYLLQKNCLDQQRSNLRKIIKETDLNDIKFLRNVNFVSELKLNILREIILGMNQNQENMNSLGQFAVNFAGKIELLDKLAKQQNLIVGISAKQGLDSTQVFNFYKNIISNQYSPRQIWMSVIKNGLVKKLIENQKSDNNSHNNSYNNNFGFGFGFGNQNNNRKRCKNNTSVSVIKQIIKFLSQEKQKNQQIVFSLIEQLLSCQVQQSYPFILPSLMMISPQCFLADKPFKQRNFDKKMENLFIPYYNKVFSELNIHGRSQNNFAQVFLLLPFFNFGQSVINKVWEELERRVSLLQKIKQKSVIKQTSLIYFQFLTDLLSKFMSWEHIILKYANDYNFKSYYQDKKLIERLLKENFDKNKKILKNNLMMIVDSYVSNQRNLAADSIKKYLRYNSKKEKYYYVGQKIGNNFFNYTQLKVGAPLKMSFWQQYTSRKIFTQTLYKIVPRIIKISQKGLMQDLQMVKTVSNISVALSLLNNRQKTQLKKVTRNFIKQISDVREDVYYVLAAIRDRLELDIDDLQEQGHRGKKKVKLDLITQIRDKKYKQMKKKQDDVLSKWLKMAQDDQQQQNEQILDKICHICKQKQSPKNRFVFPCNFTRNNIVSTLLKSEVTDLDINICLHKVHEDCFQKVKNKRQCQVCKFQVNCYIPERPLPEQNFTKNWLRNFQNIVTNINLQSGKSFNSDWSTIFLTYLVFSRSFKVLLKNTEIQNKQRTIIDNLLILHFRNQMDKWPQLMKQAITRAQKTVKGQVRRQSNLKKAVKSMALDLIFQEITNQPFKNQKRIQKKVRQLINIVGIKNSQKIAQCFDFCRRSEPIKEILETSISEQDGQKQLFKIRDLPTTAQQYLQKTSIKCPMCGKYQSSTWQCLFCEKISCQRCINVNYHCQRDHRGSTVILYLNDAEYLLMHENRQIQKDSLYRNQYFQGWRRNLKPQGWKCQTQQIYKFFDTILHSLNPNKRQINNFGNNNSDDGRDFNLLGNQNQQEEEQQQEQQQQEEYDEE